MSDLARPSGTPGTPGLLSAIAHRLAGDEPELPHEGRLGSFDGATGWVNSPPLTSDALRGRVVLVDFWTYTCVNWLRTLPYVRAWASRYAAHGLTIIGVHTPEFPFEHDLQNVIAQATALDVTWPVATDNRYDVWRSFANHFWPAVYLADTEGRIRYHHFGEGEYAMTEMAIQQLLRDGGATGFDEDLVAVEPQGLELPADYRTLRSPESYLGYLQQAGFASPEGIRDDTRHEYVAPGRLGLNHWAPIGAWTITDRAAVLGAPNGRIAFRFQARDVNLVMTPGASGRPVPFRVLLDGQPAVGATGSDVERDATGVVTEPRTYQLIREPGSVRERTFEIEFLEAGVEAYCFTFG